MSYPEKLKANLPASAGQLLELSSLQGMPYLNAVADWLRSELEVFAVSIGELAGVVIDPLAGATYR